MRMWLEFLVLLCAAWRIDYAEGLKITTLQVNDVDVNTDDKLKVTITGDLDGNTPGTVFVHLEISDSTNAIEFRKEVEIIGLEPGEDGTSFTADFPYLTTDDTNLEAELLDKLLTLNLVIKVDKDGAEVGHTSVDVTTIDIISFPTTSDLTYVPDSEAGGWIRIGAKTEDSIQGGSDLIPPCVTAPCYYYDNTFDSSTKYSQCKDITSNGDTVNLCSEESTATPLSPTPDNEVPDEVILDHSNNLQVLINPGKIGIATTVDMVIHKSKTEAPFSVTPSTCSEEISAIRSLTADCKKISIDPDLGEYKILLVGYTADTTFQWRSDYTNNNHDLAASFISTDLLETSWDHTGSGGDGLQQYHLKRNGEGPHKEAYVDCVSVGNPCISYFFGVPDADDKTYQVTIQDIIPSFIKTPNMKKVSIRTAGITKFSEKKSIDFKVIPIESVVTKVSESNIKLDLCFTYLTNTSTVDTHYEFLAVNSEGKWKKEIDIKKKDDSHACFHEIELPLVDFSENSKFFVILRDSIEGKPLASGEVTIEIPALRAIKPEVDNGNNGSTSTLAIIGAAIAGIACLMALVAAAIMFVMKINRNNDGLQYPLQHNNIEDSSTIHGLDNSIPTM